MREVEGEGMNVVRGMNVVLLQRLKTSDVIECILDILILNRERCLILRTEGCDWVLIGYFNP